MAPLRYAAKFDPFLSLDCAPTPSTLAQSKESKGSNFAVWQPWLTFLFSLYSLQDGSLQNGDHLLAIGDVRLWGMGAEQVAAILRQAGQDSIRLVVARPVDPTVPNYLVRTVLTSTKAIKH